MGERSDFNDLQLEKGLQAVKNQLLAAAAKFDESPVFDGPPAEDIPLEVYAESPAPSDGSADSGVEPRRYDLGKMISNYWYIWGTDTCWDNVERIQMRLSHLRHGVGRELYKQWDEHLRRRTVKGIRFEPGRDLGSDYVNLFEGFKLKPDSRGIDGCSKIIGHLMMLAGNRSEAWSWLIKWIAYPLQNPGAKMASSVIMYGSEGPGKSIIWEEVVKKIYGEYSVTIGQAQLESQFTGWKSKKCFALAEEVVSRSERNHHKGMLKQTVTGSTHMINEKMLPEREESNHMNFVFLSNSTVPLELDLGDRRYMVLYVDKVPEPEYFEALFDEIENGGVECFYRYLLDVNLDGFSPHTKPPMTEEKDELIAASLPSPQYFHRLWKAGELDMPYRSAVSGDLFRYFQRWCEKNGEFKRTERYFGAELKRVMPQKRINMQYPYINSHQITKRIYVAEDDSLEGNKKIQESARSFRAEFDQILRNQMGEQS